MSHRVLVVEDQIECRDIQDAFALDAESRGDGLKLELVRLAQTCGDAQDYLAALDDKPLPDAIVIDDFLPDGITTSAQALKLMSWLCEQAQRDDTPLAKRPRTVLWSTCGPNVVYAFCALGGLQYQDKRAPNGRQVPVEATWRALAGQRWRPEPYPDAKSLTTAMQQALPYIEHGMLNSEIEAQLGLGDRTLKDFVSYVQRMGRTPKAQAGHPFGTDQVSSKVPMRAAAAARCAQSNGWVWVPFPMLGYLPNSAPFPPVIDPAQHEIDLQPVSSVPKAFERRQGL